MELERAITGLILGTAVGDAVGLPFEGMSRRRVHRLLRDQPLEHRLVFGRGLVSDDTEHTCMAAQTLLASGGEPAAFGRSLGWRLRGWLLGVPAGVGLGTLRATLKLWLGVPPTRSGVASAGNGPAMRAGLLGLVTAGDEERLRLLVRTCTRITHTDPRAEAGALIIAMAARYGAQRAPTGIDASGFLSRARTYAGDELAEALAVVEEHLRQDASAEACANALGLSRAVTGYVNHTVPMALFCWLRHPGSFHEAVDAAVRLGGDTDTLSAIVGALAGATLGPEAIPPAWLNRLAEWPRSVAWMRRLARCLSQQVETGQACTPLPLFWPGLLLRNPLFIGIVLAHGFRRLLPPY